MAKYYDIKDYEGLYKVSNNGDIFNSRNNLKVLKPGTSNKGYLIVSLCKNGVPKTYLVHRLVALAFIPNPENKPTVNHKWGDKLDNRSVALEWATYSENMLHAHENGLASRHMCVSGKDHPFSKKVGQFLIGRQINIFGSAHEASRKTGIERSGICGCCRGKYKQYKGYVWKYI